jgi:hypothetical protein
MMVIPFLVTELQQKLGRGFQGRSNTLDASKVSEKTTLKQLMVSDLLRRPLILAE